MVNLNSPANKKLNKDKKQLAFCSLRSLILANHFLPVNWALYAKEIQHMELNSLDDVNALTEYQKLDKIHRIETKINKLRYVPLYSGASLIIYFLWLSFSGVEVLAPTHLILFSVVVASVGYSNVQRSDLLHDLFALKYGK